jgi:hypothetical protein
VILSIKHVTSLRFFHYRRNVRSQHHNGRKHDLIIDDYELPNLRLQRHSNCRDFLKNSMPHCTSDAPEIVKLFSLGE